jgi:hypothetical protein
MFAKKILAILFDFVTYLWPRPGEPRISCQVAFATRISCAPTGVVLTIFVIGHITNERHFVVHDRDLHSMQHDIETLICDAMRKSEAGAGVSSSVTANQILNVVKPYYQNGSNEDRRFILDKLNKLKQQPGVPFPPNLEQMLRA